MEDNLLDIDLRVSDKAKSSLLETAKWARFLAITSLIMMVLGLAFYFMTLENRMGGLERYGRRLEEEDKIGQMITALAMAFLYSYPLMLLLKYSAKLKIAVNANDSNTLEEAMVTQKKMFKYLGIVTIIFLIFMFIGVLAALGSGRE